MIIWEYFEWQFPRLHEPQRSRQPDGTPYSVLWQPRSTIAQVEPATEDRRSAARGGAQPVASRTRKRKSPRMPLDVVGCPGLQNPVVV